ncbi:hypothetical protein H9L15_13435 [Sphingomonas daechungensis]|uniref:Uncharacterized protein n=1 Tax=Sphingomonas daechungensis TaxID=1176646 RepID=A0ABX6SZX2_9SPHN|nr:hypothetical protein H9L15_13435 [Sphingomonas daechungensis]
MHRAHSAQTRNDAVQEHPDDHCCNEQPRLPHSEGESGDGRAGQNPTIPQPIPNKTAPPIS